MNNDAMNLEQYNLLVEKSQKVELISIDFEEIN